LPYRLVEHPAHYCDRKKNIKMVNDLTTSPDTIHAFVGYSLMVFISNSESGVIPHGKDLSWAHVLQV
jgi:hypothetical protein